ncbi:hypothetical protein [Methylocystis rosea]|uniref:Uncharacterized protein n=1 Tax=Methylocystis rosea TaxID=173366 RepID=A0A3G8M5K8_9HYPH|nr:hypothetical protein [Methylocystis rosea]AZG76370.1 hypothetical protein EHO51_06295 [Methylocystis rosea]
MSREDAMSKEAMQNAGGSATEKPESNTGKIVGGAIAAAIGGVIGALLMGSYAILPAAVVVGLLGVALGAVFD